MIDGNSRVTVSVGIDDPVVGTALEIFSGKHTLTITALDEGEILDRILICAK